MPKSSKTHDAGADDTTSVASNTAGKRAYIVNPPESLSVKFNRLNIYLRDNGSFDVDALHDGRAYVPDEENDDTPAFVDRDVASDTLSAVDTLPASINVSTDGISNVVTTPAQITAVNALIAETSDLQQLRDIRFSLTETLASLDSKLDELAQEN